MIALSLWQPWASAIAVGSKLIETRSWGTTLHEGRPFLAIHAAQRWNADLRKTADRFRCDLGVPLPETLPLGAVVAVVRLVDCVRMTEEWIAEEVGELELELGGYEPGRWAWTLEEPVALRQPIPATGRQRLWQLTEHTSLLVEEELGS